MRDHGQARRTDPDTSQQAALAVRPNTARWFLLSAHAVYPEGLTDEEAASSAGLSLTSEYATRCSELERAGLLVNTDAVRTGDAGMGRMVRRITNEGLEAIGLAPRPTPLREGATTPAPQYTCAVEEDGKVCGHPAPTVEPTLDPRWANGYCTKHGRTIFRRV